jgi:hypothetical protein
MDRDMISEAQRALSAVQVYIKPKVPSTVKLHALEPCSTYEAMWAMLYGPNFHAMAGLSKENTLEAPPRQT